MKAVKLDENRVFICFKDTENSAYFRYSAVVCKIINSTITVGTKTTLMSSTAKAGYFGMSLTGLNENKVFIALGGIDAYQLYGVVCTTNDLVITIGSKTHLVSYAGNALNISVTKINENKVVITHGRNSNYYYLYAIVCTISGTAITAGTDTELSSNADTGGKSSVIALSEDTIFVTHKDTNFKLYGMACTISGLTITKGDDIQLSSSILSGDIFSTVKLTQNKVLIAHSATTNYNLYAMICSITGRKITVNTDVELSTEYYSGRCISAIALNEEEVLITHSAGTQNYLFEMLCTTLNTLITANTDIQLSSTVNSANNISAVKINECLVFIAHGNTDMFGMTLNYFLNLVKKIASSTERIDGVAITSGQAGEMIKTVRPDVS